MLWDLGDILLQKPQSTAVPLQQLLGVEGITCDPDWLTGSSHGVQPGLHLSVLNSWDEPWLNWGICIRRIPSGLTFLQRAGI